MLRDQKKQKKQKEEVKGDGGQDEELVLSSKSPSAASLS
jgi:hypothetical protein